MEMLPGVADDGLLVSGEAVQGFAPDRADLEVAVETAAPSANQALQENATVMRQVAAATASLGVKQEDMQTSGLRLEPLSAPPPQASIVSFLATPASILANPSSSMQQIVGYRVWTALALKLEPSRVGQALD